MHGTYVKIIMPSSLARTKPAIISDDLVQSTKARAEAQQSRCIYDRSLYIPLQYFYSLDTKILSDSVFRAILRRENLWQLPDECHPWFNTSFITHRGVLFI